MARYAIDGVTYDIADGVDLASTVQRIRALPTHKPAPTEKSFVDWVDKSEDNRDPKALKQDFESMGALRQAGEVAVGTPEALLSMASTIPASAIGAYQGLSAAATEGLDAGANAFNKAMQDYTYTPRTTGGQLLAHDLGTAYEGVKEFVGKAAGGAPASQQAMGLQFGGMESPDRFKFSEEARAIGEGAFEGAMLTGPFAGAGKAIGARRTTKERAKYEAQIAEADALSQKLEREKQQAFSEQAKQQEFAGFDDLRKEAEPRTPYNLPESLRKQLEAELNPPVEQRKVGQPELFSTLPESAVEPRRGVPGQPLEYAPVEGGTTPPGKMALGIGEESLRPGAGGTQLTMPGLDYPSAKPRLKGPPALERDAFVTDRSAEYEARMNADEAAHRARFDAMNERQTARIQAKEHDRETLRSFDDDVRGSVEPSLSTQISGYGGGAFTAGLYQHLSDAVGRDKFTSGSRLAGIDVGQRVGLRASTGFSYIAKNHPEAAYRNLAAKLDAVAGDTPVILGSSPFLKNNTSGGAFMHRTGSILIAKDVIANDYMWMHEGVHSALVAFQNTRPSHPLNRAMQALYMWSLKDTIGFFNTYSRLRHGNAGRKWKPDEVDSFYNRRTYGFTNVKEFVAEARSNQAFQESLKEMRLSPEQARHIQSLIHDSNSVIRNAWDALKAIAAKILGYSRADKATMTLLDNVMEVSDKMFTEASKTLKEDLRTLSRNDVEKYTERQENAPSLRDFKEDLKARKIALPDEAIQAIWDKQQPSKPKPTSGDVKEVAIKQATKVKGLEQIQRQYADRRPIEEMVKDLASSEDIGMVGANVVGKMIQGRFIAKDHPLLSWVSSQIHWTKQGQIQKANNKLHGDGGTRKAPLEGSYNFIWQQLDKQSRVALNDLGQALQNADVYLGKDGIQAKAREILKRELSEKELKAYEDRVRTNKEVLSDFNKVLRAEGKEPINELPHYWSPAIFDGPFKVRFKDAAGDTKKLEAFYVRPNMEKLQKVASETGHIVELIPDSGLRGDIDWQQFEWILRQLNKEMRDPASKAISEGLRRQGFGKHGLKRKGVAGAAGTEGGTRGLRKYEEVSEKYIRQAYDYLGNRELDKLYQTINDLKEANNQPFAKTYSLEAIDAARGGSNKAFDEFSRLTSAIVSGTIQVGTAGKLVLPQRFTRDLLRYGNKVKTTLLLGFGNMPFIGAQLLQWTYTAPKLLAMAAENKMNPAVVFKAMAKAGSEYLKWNDSVDAKKLQSIGAFEATFKYDWSTYAGDANPQYKRTVADHATGISLLTALESGAVRRPATLMFLEMLRESGYESIAKNKDEIYYVAKELTDQYMVSNRFYEKPHMFSRTGLVGMATSPLQSFSTTWLGMLREYSKLSAEGILEGSVSKQLPIAAFLGISLLTSGLTGFIGVKEWDYLAALLNKYAGYNVPTGTEYILSKFKSDKLRFGLLSDALGINIGATFNSPTLTGSFAPGMQALGAVPNLAWQGVKATGVMGEANKPTDVDLREAFKGVAPRFYPHPKFGWGGIEEMSTPPGQPYPEASGKAGPYTRTEKDWTARKWGTYTLDEMKEKTRHYTAQKAMVGRSTALGKTMNRAVDIMLNPKHAESRDRLPKLWQGLAEQGFNGNEIKEGLQREVMSRLIEADQMAAGHAKTSKQQQLIMLYQQLR